MASGSSNRATRDGAVAWGVALLLHAVLASGLLLVRGEWPRGSAAAGSGDRVAMRLAPPVEGPRAGMMAAGMLPGIRNDSPDERVSDRRDDPEEDEVPEVASPRPPDPQPPPPAPAAQAELDDQTLRELERERERLRAELERERQLAEAIAERAMGQAARSPDRAPAPAAGGGSVPLGTVRELSLDGYPEHVVQEIMDRYELRVVEKAVAGGSNQNFLSSASTAEGGRFIADRGGAPGVYQVFMLSRKAVATMSRLEEEEIRRRGLDPMRTRVTRVKFGIVGHPPETDLGVLLLEAQPLTPAN